MAGDPNHILPEALNVKHKKRASMKGKVGLGKRHKRAVLWVLPAEILNVKVVCGTTKLEIGVGSEDGLLWTLFPLILQMGNSCSCLELLQSLLWLLRGIRWVFPWKTYRTVYGILVVQQMLAVNINYGLVSVLNGKTWMIPFHFQLSLGRKLNGPQRNSITISWVN